MRYVSTRGQAPELGFADVLLAGLATDGGLYVPVEFPPLPELDRLDAYAAVAAAVMQPYVGDELERGGRSSGCATTPMPRSATRRGPAGADRPPALAARAVPRSDVGVQGRRSAARRPHVRPRAGRARRADHDRRRHQRRHRLGRHRRGQGLRQRRHRDPLSGGAHERRAAAPDDHRRRTQRACRRRGGHLRRLPGSGQGDVRRRHVP